MSHIVTCKALVKDQAAIAAACRRLGLEQPVHGTAKLFSGDVTGLLLQLPGWQYPAVIDTTSGELRYDNFEGNWGDEAALHRFLQAYAVEKTKIEARRKGYTVSEQTLSCGAIKLQIVEGG